MRNVTIRKTGSAILALVIGISSVVSPIAAQAMNPNVLTCESCTHLPILQRVFGPQA